MIARQASVWCGCTLACGVIAFQGCTHLGLASQISDIAIQEVSVQEGWSPNGLEVSKIIREDDHWAVIVWHLPARPGDSRVVLISDEMGVIGYEGGK